MQLCFYIAVIMLSSNILILIDGEVLYHCELASYLTLSSLKNKCHVCILQYIILCINNVQTEHRYFLRYVFTQLIEFMISGIISIIWSRLEYGDNLLPKTQPITIKYSREIRRVTSRELENIVHTTLRPLGSDLGPVHTGRGRRHYTYMFFI